MSNLNINLSLQSRWESYLKEVVPKDAGEAQVQGTRQAFYAGCICVLDFMEMISEIPDNAKVNQIIEFWYQETEHFVAEFIDTPTDSPTHPPQGNH